MSRTAQYEGVEMWTRMGLEERLLKCIETRMEKNGGFKDPSDPRPVGRIDERRTPHSWLSTKRQVKPAMVWIHFCLDDGVFCRHNR